jgi:hypothetical protein
MNGILILSSFYSKEIWILKIEKKNDEWDIDLPMGEMPVTYVYLMV